MATNRSRIRAGKPRRLGRFRARLDARPHDRRPRPYRHWRAGAAVPQQADACSGAQHSRSAPTADVALKIITPVKARLIKIGAKVVTHGRYVAFQMAEVAIPRDLFADILRMIAELRAPVLASTA